MYDIYLFVRNLRRGIALLKHELMEHFEHETKQYNQQNSPKRNVLDYTTKRLIDIAFHPSLHLSKTDLV